LFGEEETRVEGKVKRMHRKGPERKSESMTMNGPKQAWEKDQKNPLKEEGHWGGIKG